MQTKEQKRARYAAKKAANPHFARDARRKNVLGFLVSKAKRRAKMYGIPFTLARKEWPSIPKMCPILGIPLAASTTGKPVDGSPSIDRIDPTKGYVPGNVWVISFRANTIKNSGTAREHEAIANAMRTRGFRMKSAAWFAENKEAA